MTGLDRLRGYARRMDELHVWPGGAKLREIADQIEREQDAMVADSPYEALPPEDREAIAWVRDHGGLDAVRERWAGGMKLSHVRNLCDKHKARHERQQRHIEFVQVKCRERQERIVALRKELAELRKVLSDYRDALGGMCERLGLTDGTSLPEMPEAICEALDRRLMPEGGWPRYEDGEMVLVGSDFADGIGETHTVTSIEFFEDCVELHWNPDEPGEFEWLEPGERVKRPAPKVLDADGVEIRVGDTVWHEDGSELVVEGFGDEEDGETLVRVSDMSETSVGWSECRSLSLTHERPESWERIEEDALSFVEDNAGIPHDQDQMERDMLAILRRCRALAERGE